jgi:hypothetical protein
MQPFPREFHEKSRSDFRSQSELYEANDVERGKEALQESERIGTTALEMLTANDRFHDNFQNFRS